jgi:uncharacterized membrane protein YbhN (UPF0104 family)
VTVPAAASGTGHGDVAVVVLSGPDRGASSEHRTGEGHTARSAERSDAAGSGEALDAARTAGLPDMDMPRTAEVPGTARPAEVSGAAGPGEPLDAARTVGLSGTARAAGGSGTARTAEVSGAAGPGEPSGTARTAGLSGTARAAGGSGTARTAEVSGAARTAEPSDAARPGEASDAARTAKPSDAARPAECSDAARPGEVPDVPSATTDSAVPGHRTGAPVPGSPRALLARLGSRKARTRLGTVAGVAIVGVLFWRLGTGAFVDGLRRIDAVTLLLALGIGAVTTVFSAWRWALVARGLRIRLPFGPAVADYYRALFLNAALPGGVLGDVHRAVRHGQSQGDLRRGVKAVVLERAAGQLALFAAAAVVLLTMPSPVLGQARHIAPLAALAGLGALAVVLALRMNRAASARRAGKARALLAEAREGLLSRRNGPGVLASSVVVLAGYVAMFVLAARVAGTTASVAVLVPLAVLALLAMGLPLNVGGWGPREGVTAWAFGAAGLGADRGLAVAVVYGVLSLVASLPGLAVLVARWYGGLRAADRARAAAADPDAGPAPRSAYASEVSIEKYVPKDSARLARSSFPFSAEPSEGRPMTPESV